MKLYTKMGDAGETSLYGGNRVPKDCLRIRTYGTIDELNASLGVALAVLPPSAPIAGELQKIQSELFQLGAELASPRGQRSGAALIEDVHVEALERGIDAMEATLTPLTSFVLPGGSPAAAHLHLARTISRRAEREFVSLNRSEPQRGILLRYMNRLSDYLFVAARFANHLSHIPDLPWNTR
ncbi:MAG: cob(I)yrinic acid a,c-diamide adenosyltransferase [Oligoflexia bacterium]|nr:cob(I)yrinic acid a,c-diamide adenosyltransferase [Oligoflexia bacterium]